MPRDRWSVWADAAIIALTGAATYANSFRGVLLFDDREHILGGRRLRTLWPPWEAFTRHRPVVDYSLAVNYTLHGEDPWGYHLVNVVVHVLAGMTLFGVVRRTLRTKLLGERFGSSSTWLALVSAMFWMVHPLQTQSVTYVIQRAESMMGLFYLLTLYCVLRGSVSTQRMGWYVAAVLSSALGMGSKAVMVTAPLVVLLYDRTFLAGTFREALRRRWGLYLGLLASWACLWTTARGVLTSQNPAAHVGFGYKGITPSEYLQTQVGVLVEYLKLAWWPHPLCFDYQWPVARETASVFPATVAMSALLSGAIWATYRRLPIGFAAACFFLILAPTSSLIPIRDPMFEHRMYLPLAAVIVLVVLAVHSLGRRWAVVGAVGTMAVSPFMAIAVALLGGILGMGTIRRNAVYHDEVGMWRDVVVKRPQNSRAAENYGTALLGAQKLGEALSVLKEAVELSPKSATLRNVLGFALVAHREFDEAITEFTESLRLNQLYDRAWVNLGLAFLHVGKPDEALACLHRALQINPGNTDARLELGNYYFGKKQFEEAVTEYSQLVRNDPRHAKGWGNLGTSLLQLGRTTEAIDAFQRAQQLDPKSTNVLNSLAVAYMMLKRTDEAIKTWRDLLWLSPNDPGIHYNLAQAFVEKKDYKSAVPHFIKAIEASPREPRYRIELARVLVEMDRLQEAVHQLEPVLQLDPNYPGAARLLEELKTKLQSSQAPAP